MTDSLTAAQLRQLASFAEKADAAHLPFPLTEFARQLWVCADETEAAALEAETGVPKCTYPNCDCLPLDEPEGRTTAMQCQKTSQPGVSEPGGLGSTYRQDRSRRRPPSRGLSSSDLFNCSVPCWTTQATHECSPKQGSWRLLEERERPPVCQMRRSPTCRCFCGQGT